MPQRNTRARTGAAYSGAKERALSQRWSNLLVWAGTIAFIVIVSKEAWAGNPVNATTLASLLVIAIPPAGIYAMAASGLVVVYTTTGIFNFAQGAIGMFLAYIDW